MRPTSVRIEIVVGVAHVDAEDVGARLEQLLDHLLVGRGRTERGEDLDLAAASHWTVCSRAGGSAVRCGLVGQLDHPACLFARVIFLESGALESAGEAIVDAGDLELFFGHAHVDRAVPAPAALGIFCIKIVKPR